MLRSRILGRLAANPRLTGALLTFAILFVQIAPVLAGNGGGGGCADCGGP